MRRTLRKFSGDVRTHAYPLQLRQGGLAGGKSILEIRGFHVRRGDHLLLRRVLEGEYIETENNQEGSEAAAN